MPRIALPLLLLALLGAGLQRPAQAEEPPGWEELLRRTAQAFARPGALGAKRAVLQDLAASKRLDTWVLAFAALEQEGQHMDRLAARRSAAWSDTLELWNLPRGQHHEAHARRLRQAFSDLGAADERWFREKMVVGQLEALLGHTPSAPWAEFVKQATAPVSLVHPLARAAVAQRLATGLAKAPSVAALRPLLERDPSDAVRLAALRALPSSGPGVTPLIMRRLRDPSWVVRLAASRAAHRRDLGEAVPLLRGALRRAGPREAMVHRASLRGLGEKAAEPTAPALTLHGAALPSRHVVFVLDCSAVMAPYLNEARDELAKTIAALPADATFGLVAYHGAVVPWHPGVVPATDKNKATARAWLHGLKAEWNACLGGALREAFRLAQLAPHEGAETPIDTIVILAAGRPTRYAPGKAGPLPRGALERLVRAWNLDRRLRIQAFAYGNGGTVVPLLKRLTQAYDGTLTRP